LWHLFTSVDFAVFQIIFLALLAVIGMTIKQLPDFAFRSATDYATAMDQLHARYDPVLGQGIVDIMERLSLFAVFRSPWFSAGLVVLVTSIVVCTLDRTPKLWRGVSDVRVAQPEPFFDPILPDRAAMDGVPADGVRAVLRRNGFHIREETDAGGTRFLYGDRHQYTKMATLLTHRLRSSSSPAAAARPRERAEQGLEVRIGVTADRQSSRSGRPGLLLVGTRLPGARPRYRGRRPTHDDLPSTGRHDRARDDGSTTRCPSPATLPPERVRARPQSSSSAGGEPSCGTPRADDRDLRAALRLLMASPVATRAQAGARQGRRGAGARHSRHPVHVGRHRQRRPTDRGRPTRSMPSGDTNLAGSGLIDAG
jgi:hypothetical protein